MERELYEVILDMLDHENKSNTYFFNLLEVLLNKGIITGSELRFIKTNGIKEKEK